MTFALILVLLGGESTYVVDSNLSATDCEIRLEMQEDLLTHTFATEDFELWCEMEVKDY